MTVEVHLVTPECEVWSGDAQMLIARGVEGEVGILGGHEPLLVQLAIGPLRIHREGGVKLSAVVDGGFLHVGTHEGVTRADVLAVRAELEEDIDLEAARREVGRLRAEMVSAPDDETLKAELRKAQARVDLAG